MRYILTLWIFILIGQSLSIKVYSQSRVLAANETNRTSTSSNDTQMNDTKRNSSNLDEATYKKANILPQVFWVNKMGQPGREFVAFKSFDNKSFLSCQDNGILSLEDREFRDNELWRFIYIEDDTIALKSHIGGFIGMVNNNLTCNHSEVDDKSRLRLILSSNQTNTAYSTNNMSGGNNTVRLMLNDQYISLQRGNVSLSKILQEHSVLMPPNQVSSNATLPSGQNNIEIYKK